MQPRLLPSYCHHKATGQAFLRLTVDGKQKTIYLGPHNSRESLEKYNQVVSEWLATKAAPLKQTGLCIADLAQRFLLHGSRRPDKSIQMGSSAGG